MTEVVPERMVGPYVAPSFQSNRFHCPFCRAFAHQTWKPLYVKVPMKGSSPGVPIRMGYSELKSLCLSECFSCKRCAIWFGCFMIHPVESTAPMPHEDLPQDIAVDYLEARNILSQSPRGAAALLRLAIQKLCKHLGEPGNNLNDDIGSLVSKGLPFDVKQALDIVRVTGNNALHPGEMDVTNDPEIARKRFDLVNLIVREMITRPREIAALHDSLPDGAKKAIADRDSTATGAGKTDLDAGVSLRLGDYVSRLVRTPRDQLDRVGRRLPAPARRRAVVVLLQLLPQIDHILRLPAERLDDPHQVLGVEHEVETGTACFRGEDRHFDQSVE